ncbi:MAG: hypothetical protein ACYC7L_17585 [Nitrospirota bacterium]
MTKKIRLGIGKHMLNIPAWLVGMEKKMAQKKARYEAAMEFMTEEHRRVHHYAVKELPKAGAPLSPDAIAAAVGIGRGRINVLLEDLERHLTFLYRHKGGGVAWAYPVTVDETPHRLTFSTGEEVYAA